jgi:hypothetical protein
MTVIEIIGKSLALYRRNFAVLFGISLVAVPFEFAIFGGYLIARHVAVLGLGMMLVSGYLGLVVSGALTCAVGAAAEGASAGIGDSYRRALDVSGSLLTATVRVYGVFLLIAFPWAFVVFPSIALLHLRAVFLVVPVSVVALGFFAYFQVRWAFIVQAVVLEDADGGEALSLSAELVRGRWWRVFITLFVAMWLVGIVSNLPSLLVQFTVSWPASRLIGIPIGAVVGPYAATVGTLLFLALAGRNREPEPPVASELTGRSSGG